ncbi:unnamed protein product [Protopolystoma xenopodis]|uniref:Uncharacterized protein n=1 Tax=Protopolystoma xenopodis TaxID=117903 RepID=A0A3S5BMZ0_9PLAT|nr:unnamed protein product [Protopolystoma xenopodis]
MRKGSMWVIFYLASYHSPSLSPSLWLSVSILPSLSLSSPDGTIKIPPLRQQAQTRAPNSLPTSEMTYSSSRLSPSSVGCRLPDRSTLALACLSGCHAFGPGRLLTRPELVSPPRPLPPRKELGPPVRQGYVQLEVFVVLKV